MRNVFRVVFAASLVCGCKASVNADVRASGDVEARGTSTESSGSGAGASFDPAADSRSLAPPAGEPALLGARQDVSLGDSATTECECLAVGLGQSSDAAFQWSGARPSTSPDSQLVIALRSDGVPCPAAGASPPGASYWGYEASGSDIVVVVENAAPGRPVARGAIIPRPAPGGHVYVRPVAKSVPYGRSKGGSEARCLIAAK